MAYIMTPLAVLVINLLLIRWAFKAALANRDKNITNIMINERFPKSDIVDLVLVDFDPTDHIRYLIFIYKFVSVKWMAISIKRIKYALDKNREFLENPAREFSKQDFHTQLNLATSFYFNLELWVSPLKHSGYLRERHNNDINFVNGVYFKDTLDPRRIEMSELYRTRYIEKLTNV